MPVAKFTQPDYTSQSGTAYPLNIDADFKVLSETGLDFAPRAADTPNMTVIVESGTLLTAAGLVNVGQQTSDTIVAPVTPNNRIDRVVMNRTTGIINVVTGTPAVSPVAPAIPADRLPICQFTVIPLQTSILNSGITDERTFTVGAGTMAFQNASEVAITGGTASGVAITGSTFNALTTGNASGNIPINNGTLNTNLNADLLDGLTTGNASGNIPVSNGTVNTNLNADMVEGFHASATPGADIIPVHDANGNMRLGRVVGIGTAPDTNHDPAFVASCIEVGEWGLFYSRIDNTYVNFARNAKIVGGNWVYRNSGEEAQFIQFGIDGGIEFSTAVAGTAGAAISRIVKLNIPNAAGQPMTYEGNVVRHNGNTFHGRVAVNGAAIRLPPGWTSTQDAAGVYTITHNLGTLNYTPTASPASTPSVGSAPTVAAMNENANSFQIWAWNEAGTLVNMYCNFILMLD